MIRRLKSQGIDGILRKDDNCYVMQQNSHHPRPIDRWLALELCGAAQYRKNASFSIHSWGNWSRVPVTVNDGADVIAALCTTQEFKNIYKLIYLSVSKHCIFSFPFCSFPPSDQLHLVAFQLVSTSRSGAVGLNENGLEKYESLSGLGFIPCTMIIKMVLIVRVLCQSRNHGKTLKIETRVKLQNYTKISST